MNANYEKITNKVLEMLEHGVAPWSRPWRPGDRPRNAISKKPYRGVNVWILESERQARGYSSNVWMTFKQSKDIGGSLKGQHGTEIIFWKMLPITDEAGEPKIIPYLRTYHVFNLDQVEGVDKSKYLAQSDPIGDPIEAAEQIVVNMPDAPKVRLGGDQAFYSTLHDFVQMPLESQFKTVAGKYATLFHELGHATGHAKRLGRFAENHDHTFGSSDYSREELVAEMTSAFLCGEAGITEPTIENSAAYLKSWAAALKDDKTMIVRAAAAAQRASDYILGHKEEKVDEE